MEKRGHFLLISTNRVWRKHLGDLLKKQRNECIESDDVEHAAEIPSRSRIDAIVLDLMNQPHIRETCRMLKKAPIFKEVPILAFIMQEQLCQLHEADDIEDFIIQQDSYDEALVRINRVLWRKRRELSKDAVTIGDLIIESENYEVLKNGQSVYLTFKEFELLKFLLLNKGRVFSRDDLLDRVWGYDNYVGTRTVDIHIQRLRTKLGSPVGDMIVTVRNVGYKLAP